jgi:NTP pyrophosphatase (non-canonical NTP hydrolase)
VELSAFQQKVSNLTATWTDPKEPANTEAIVMLLTEEFGELVRAIRKTRGERSGHPGEGVGSSEDVAAELGDVLFLLARLALVSGVEMETAAATVIEKINRRSQKE